MFVNDLTLWVAKVRFGMFSVRVELLLIEDVEALLISVETVIMMYCFRIEEGFLKPYLLLYRNWC